MLAAAALLIALAVGSEPLSGADVWRAFIDDAVTAQSQIVLELRLPRALTAFAAGGLLAVAGCMMQVLLRNPLADPYVLGLAGGAATGTLSAMLLGLSPFAVQLAGWAGALVSILLVVVLSARELLASDAAETQAASRMLLIGVALATGWGAYISLILALAPDASLRGMLFWLMGELDGQEQDGYALFVLMLFVLCGVLLGRSLNMIMRGVPLAYTLGVNVRGARVATLLIASGATAVAVAHVGSIGFVGLLVPNAVRLAIGNDQRWVIPVAALGGGALLTLADTVARSVAAPTQLPAGAVMAIIGVPAFVWLVTRRMA
jgi:iron complex transport system permease protein